MNKIFNGFLLEVGFSFAFAICMAVWTLTAAPRIEVIFNETYGNIKSDFELSILEALKLKVTNTIVKDDQIVVSYSMVNMSQSSLAALYTVRFSLLTNDGTLIGNFLCSLVQPRQVLLPVYYSSDQALVNNL